MTTQHEKKWTVFIDLRPEDHSLLDPSTQRMLRERLPGLGSVSASRITATLDVEAASEEEARQAGADQVRMATAAAGVVEWPIRVTVRLET